jgi:hypothetical protein
LLEGLRHKVTTFVEGTDCIYLPTEDGPITAPRSSEQSRLTIPVAYPERQHHDPYNYTSSRTIWTTKIKV